MPEKKRLRVESRLPRTFWRYAAFSAATMFGFSTWAVLAFHLSEQHLVSPAVVPVLYAVAMAAASLAAVGFGRIYDRVGLRGLLACRHSLRPCRSCRSRTRPRCSSPARSYGVRRWAAHDSTMRAAVADLVPAHRRGAGFGTFTAIYGLAWLAGTTVIGWLYGRGVAQAAAFIVVVQVVALGLLLFVLATRPQTGPE